MRHHRLFALLSLCTFLFTTPALADWKTTDLGRAYVNNNGHYTTGLASISNRYYYFSSEGIIQTGVQQIAGRLFFFNTQDGHLETGFIHSDGKIYYGHTRYGYLYTSTFFTKKAGTRTYYASEDGTLATGVTEINGNTYCFNEDTGRMVKNKKRETAEGTYFFKADGTAVKDSWVTIGEDLYYFGADGKMLSSTFKDGYYIGSDGKRTTFTQDELIQDPENGEDTLFVDKTFATAGERMAAFGQLFVGNPYVWGGTSLTQGADCSGFVQTIHKKFGFTLLRVAHEQFKGPSDTQVAAGYTKGIGITREQLLPGDLVFYGASGYASHVAMYIGDGKIVHAANSRQGIITSSIDYSRTPIGYMRYWDASASTVSDTVTDSATDAQTDVISDTAGTGSAENTDSSAQL